MVYGDNGDINVDGTVDMTSSAVAGTSGDDLVHGDAGQDRIYGQLGNDDIYGDAGEDYVVGDLGFITPGSPTGFWPGGAPKYEVALSVHSQNRRCRRHRRRCRDDHLFGGAANDVNQADPATTTSKATAARLDVRRPSAGRPAASDEDDLIGGSSVLDSSAGSGPGRRRAVMQGNPDHDVMTGDNADITRIAPAPSGRPTR